MDRQLYLILSISNRKSVLHGRFSLIFIDPLCDQMLICRLVQDLTEWATLYSAGRLQKPVRVIKEGVNAEIIKALDTNRRSAFRVSLLMMPPIFDQMSLFHAIASLSYVGEQFQNKNQTSRSLISLSELVWQCYFCEVKIFLFHSLFRRSANASGRKSEEGKNKQCSILIQSNWPIGSIPLL